MIKVASSRTDVFFLVVQGEVEANKVGQSPRFPRRGDFPPTVSTERTVPEER